MFGTFYSSILLSIGISLAIYGSSTLGYAESFMAARIYFTCIYLIASVIIVILAIYLTINRNTTFDIGNGEAEFIFVRNGERVNLYLRFGVTIFGIGSLVFACSAAYIHYLDSSSPTSTIFHGLSEALFITLQTLFILYYHRLIMLIHENIMKVILLHFVVSNMLMWSSSSIGKVSEEFQASNACKQSSTTVICKLCTYLQPIVSEYTVITFAVIYEIYLRIGKENLIELGNEKEETLRFSRKFIPGLIIGFLIVFGCIFSSISSVILGALDIGDEWIYYYHSSLMLLLNIFGIVVLIMAYLRIRKMKFSFAFTTNPLDKNILFISFVLSINFSLLVLINCGNFLILNLYPNLNFHLQLRIFSAFFEIIESSLQTYFLIDWFQRCSYNSDQKNMEPGRNYVAIIFGINLGMWFLWTLELKNGDFIYLYENDENVFLSTKVITSDIFILIFQIMLPFGMLYRFHSSACLSEIFIKMYHTESERFVHHFKFGNLQNETLPTTNDKIKHICFKNFGYDFDNISNNSIPIRLKRSMSLDINSIAAINKRKSRKRGTIKNIEDAQHKFILQQILHKIHKRKLKEKTSKENVIGEDLSGSLYKINEISSKTLF